MAKYNPKSVYGTFFSMLENLPQKDQDWLMDKKFGGSFLKDIKENPKGAYGVLNKIVVDMEDGKGGKAVELLKPYEDKLFMMKAMLKDYGNFKERRMRMDEGISYKYNFSGDRYIDYALSYWLEWWNKENNRQFDPTNKQLDELFLEKGFDKLAEIIFEEFPICARTTNCDFDAKWCWDLFTDTKEGRKAEAWLEESGVTKIDSSIVNEYLDYNLIAESLGSEEIDLLKGYLASNKDAKLLKKADKDKIVTAFEEGVFCELSNGFAFTPNEYAEVAMCVNDESGATEEDLDNLMKNRASALKKGNLLVRTNLWNPRLYNGEDIDFVFEILIGTLVYEAVRH